MPHRPIDTLSWYLHQPESHSFINFSQWQTSRPIDPTPNTPDKKSSQIRELYLTEKQATKKMGLFRNVSHHRGSSSSWGGYAQSPNLCYPNHSPKNPLTHLKITQKFPTLPKKKGKRGWNFQLILYFFWGLPLVEKLFQTGWKIILEIGKISWRGSKFLNLTVGAAFQLNCKFLQGSKREKMREKTFLEKRSKIGSK